MTSSSTSPGEKHSNLRTKHITTACLRCRRKKIKCSGETPSCFHCLLYSQTCVYQHDSDKRKVPVKERLIGMETYVRDLEQLLRANGIAVPKSERAALLGRSDTRKKEYRDYPPEDGKKTPLLQVDARLATPKQTASGCATPTSDNDPLMEQLSGRIGSLQIAEDGQLRFYGATSNLHIIQNGLLTRTRPHHSVNDSFESILLAAGVGHTVRQELEDHLLKLYFCWEDPSIHCVNEKVFFRERAKCKTTGHNSHLYSEALTNSMCAVAASMTTRQCSGLPHPLADFFAARAKALLNVEMAAPTISTVQSFVILSAVEAILCRDACGWLYSGMAVRLAVDLGLHLDLQSYVDTSVIDHEEAVLRSTVFWGAFVHDRMWSLYVGRPVALEDKHITLATPMDHYEPLEQHSWQPYLDECAESDFLNLPNPIEQVTKYNVSLCAKMCRIRELLYADSKGSSQRFEETHNFAVVMRVELKEWLSSLPEVLVVDLADMTTFYLPHVLQLHMQYHTVMILVNRPFFSAPKGLVGIMSKDIFSARSACTEAATTLAMLLRIYRRLYTLRRINVQAVHLIFTAGLIHVYNACGSSDATIRDLAMDDLEVCCQALSEMGQQFKNAMRSMEVIICIKGELLKRNRNKRQKKALDYAQTGALTKRQRYTTLTANDVELGVQIASSMSMSDTPSLSAFESGVECGIGTDDAFALESLFWTDFANLDYPQISR